MRLQGEYSLVGVRAGRAKVDGGFWDDLTLSCASVGPDRTLEGGKNGESPSGSVQRYKGRFARSANPQLQFKGEGVGLQHTVRHCSGNYQGRILVPP